MVVIMLTGTVDRIGMRTFEVSAQDRDDAWKKEFEDICSKNDEVMALNKAEVKALVARCDALKPRLEKLDETTRTVYLKRLKMCRGLFVFVLESTPK